MPDGGSLTIETANLSLDERGARDREMTPGDYIAIHITDTGTGMTPEVLARAFDPFFTTKPLGSGTGLGLSMVYGFAHQSDGQLKIATELGKGTTISIYLPRYIGEAEEAAQRQLAEIRRADAGETVVVVDDEPMVRMLISETLKELGYNVLEASDGVSGLKALRSDARIGLLITDVGLPGGMNGRQMADVARQTRPELKVLFVTGYAESAAVASNGRLEPGMHVLGKPFAMDALSSKVSGILVEN
jgi:CheY-like chemotaxis protein